MVGIIGAMKIEIEALSKLLENTAHTVVSGVDFITGTFKKFDVVMAVSGVGKVNAALTTEAMILKFNPEFIINTGVGGAISDTLKIADIAISNDVVEHDMDTTPLGEPKGFISGLNTVSIPADNFLIEKLEKAISLNKIYYEIGTIASGDQFINSFEKKAEIKEEFNAICCEMEGASIGHVCALNEIPFCVLRAISDGADESSHLSFEKFTEIACKNTVLVLDSFFSNL